MVARVFLFLVCFGVAFAEQPFLELEPLYLGDQPLFPGQRAWVGYRLRYNLSIDLAEEKLPLLEAQGFKKIGEKEIRTKEEQGVTTRQILQRIEAVTAGKFTFPPATVAGFGYKEEGGRKTYLKAEFRGSTSDVVLEVADFPEKGKLPSFSGAVGSFSVASSLETSPDVHQGDPLNVRLEISGKGDFETVRLPDLCCQPGFSGFFGFSDLPPSMDSSADKQVFHLQLQPKNWLVKELPPIYFTSYDPASKTYKTVSTKPLSLKVDAPLPVLEQKESVAKERVQVQRGFIFIPSRLGDLSLLIAWFSEVNPLLLLLPAASVLMAYNFWRERKKPQSFSYLQEALRVKDQDAAFLLLEQALKCARSEGRILNGEGYDALRKKIELRRYSTMKSFSFEEALKELKELWPGL